MGCGQTDGLQSPQIRPPNRGTLSHINFIVSIKWYTILNSSRHSIGRMPMESEYCSLSLYTYYIGDCYMIPAL